MSKLTNCHACRATVARNAILCPNCGQRSPGVWRPSKRAVKRVLYAFGAVVILMVVAYSLGIGK